MPPATPAPAAPASMLRAHIEGVLVLVIAVVASGSLKAALIDTVPPHALEHAMGLGNLLIATGILCLLYGGRFQPSGVAPGAAAAAALRGLAGTLARPVGVYALGIAAYHVVQAAAAAHLAGASLLDFRGGAGPAWHCTNAASLLWAPAYEELLFRVVIFYVVLKQAGGAVLPALLITSSVFAAIHVSNLFGAGGEDVAYVWLQVAAAIISGIVFALLFAVSGSLWGPLLAHVANNASALVWMSLQAPAGDKGACATAFSLQLALLLLAQLVCYATVGVFLWYRLWAMISPPPAAAAHHPIAGAAGGIVAARAAPDSISDVADANTARFRQLHPLVYGPVTVAAPQAQAVRDR
jgi:membrane protease YdiL (CAAX protease family)